jgi:hypothetical protein
VAESPRSTINPQNFSCALILLSLSP